MLKRKVAFVLPLSVLLTGAAGHGDDFWAHWGDGKAELSGYRLVQPRYGEKREGKAVLIFVTEDHSVKEKVKIEGDPSRVPARERFSVLKLNDVRSFPTGIYDYDVTTSVFSRVDQKFAVSKISLGVQEWCGHVYHQVVTRGNELRESLHSYFGGEGDQANVHRIPRHAVFEDNIPILIRELRGPWLKPGERREAPGAPSLLALRLQHKPFAWGTIVIEKGRETENVRSAFGVVKATRWTVTTPHSGTFTYLVEAAYPRRILKWTTDRGESAELTGTTRLPYWKLNKEGDERHLRELFP